MCLPGPSAPFPLWCYFLSDFTSDQISLYLVSGGAALRMSKPLRTSRRRNVCFYFFIAAAAFVCRHKPRKSKNTTCGFNIKVFLSFLLWLLVCHCQLLDMCYCDTCQNKVKKKCIHICIYVYEEESVGLRVLRSLKATLSCTFVSTKGTKFSLQLEKDKINQVFYWLLWVLSPVHSSDVPSVEHCSGCRVLVTVRPSCLHWGSLLFFSFLIFFYLLLYSLFILRHLFFFWTFFYIYKGH